MIKLQDFGPGEIWKCNCGPGNSVLYRYKENGEIVGTYKTVVELVQHHGTETQITKKKNKK